MIYDIIIYNMYYEIYYINVITIHVQIAEPQSSVAQLVRFWEGDLRGGYRNRVQNPSGGDSQRVHHPRPGQQNNMTTMK